MHVLAGATSVRVATTRTDLLCYGLMAHSFISNSNRDSRAAISSSMSMATPIFVTCTPLPYRKTSGGTSIKPILEKASNISNSVRLFSRRHTAFFLYLIIHFVVFFNFFTAISKFNRNSLSSLHRTV